MLEYSRYQALCLPDLLRDQAQRNANSVAIAAWGRAPLTYDCLWSHAADVGRELNAVGVSRNDRVALVVPNGAEMAVAFIAVACCATAAPLNPAYRANEFDFYLSDLNAKALIVQTGIDSPALAVARQRSVPIIELSPLPEDAAGIFTLSGDALEGVGSPNSKTPDPLHFAEAEDIALILYTSGTTSKPKMVPLTHSNLLASAGNIAATLQLTAADRCLNVMPLFHIHGLVGAVLSSMTAGSSVVCTTGLDTEQFFPWLEEFRPTWYTAVPGMHQALLARLKQTRETVVRSSLRFIRSSSAPLPAAVMAELEELFKAPVIEAYGMTEASHQIASNPLPPRERKAGSVGLATATEVAVMDEREKVLPRGEIGEIVIRGAGLTQGYGNDPETNRSSFVGGWFKTGDLGYLDEDGYLFVTGRLKEIINRGGEKISPREVDDALMDHPDICQAAAFAAPHPTLGEDVAAAVVLRENRRLTESMIREYLLGRLADFKVPAKVWIVDEIPKGPTGKIQRAGLAEKFSERLKRDFIPPKNKLEAMVAAIYAEVLNFERVGADGNFFALGGDSLRAMQVLSRIRATFQVNLSIATLFRKVTVAELAEEIAGSAESVEPSVIAEILTEVTSLSDEAAEKLLADELDQDPSA